MPKIGLIVTQRVFYSNRKGARLRDFYSESLHPHLFHLLFHGNYYKGHFDTKAPFSLTFLLYRLTSRAVH